MSEQTTGVTEALSRASREPTGTRLRVLEGPDQGLDFDLPQGAAHVGKSSGCELTLTDAAVSARHVRIEVTETGLRVTDLDSTNGTFYLQSELHQAVLPLGAVIVLGRTRLALASRQPAVSAEYSAQCDYGRLVGGSPAMRALYALLERLEPHDQKVLIQGETGVGKELVAREIHAHSRFCDEQFVVFDCGAVPVSLAESLLFGHVRGAFSGADRNHIGVFENANGGTLFLDEIGELPLQLQPALLRVLETGEVTPVGGNSPRPARPRVLAATNRDLAVEVEAGRFREDLYYRLSVVTVRVPSLGERREDIPYLVSRFLEESGQSDVALPADTIELLTTGYDWPGNVRELHNVMTRVVVLGEIPERPGTPTAPEQLPVAEDLGSFPETKRRVIEAFERDYLQGQLSRAEGNLSQAARLSGLDRTYFKRLLKRHGLHATSDR